MLTAVKCAQQARAAVRVLQEMVPYVPALHGLRAGRTTHCDWQSASARLPPVAQLLQLATSWFSNQPREVHQVPSASPAKDPATEGTPMEQLPFADQV